MVYLLYPKKKIQWSYAMLLPRRITIKDIENICNFLANKPAGATVTEIRRAFGKRDADGLKLSACGKLGFVDRDSRDRTTITKRGRIALRRTLKQKSRSYLDAILSVPAYKAVVQRVAEKGDFTITPREVAAIWHKDFPSGVSKTENVGVEQANCLFRLLEGAALGSLTLGTGKRRTVFAFDEQKIRRVAREGKEDHPEEKGRSSAEAEKAETTDKAGHVGRVEELAEEQPGRSEGPAADDKGGEDTVNDPLRQVLAALARLQADIAGRDAARIKENAQLRADINKLLVETADRELARARERSRLQADIDQLRMESAEREAASAKVNPDL